MGPLSEGIRRALCLNVLAGEPHAIRELARFYFAANYRLLAWVADTSPQRGPKLTLGGIPPLRRKTRRVLRGRRS
jgi:hypothetical protein